mgnify:CR=1 FL=1
MDDRVAEKLTWAFSSDQFEDQFKEIVYLLSNWALQI